jgi:hypothetical protein
MVIGLKECHPDDWKCRAENTKAVVFSYNKEELSDVFSDRQILRFGKPEEMDILIGKVIKELEQAAERAIQRNPKQKAEIKKMMEERVASLKHQLERKHFAEEGFKQNGFQIVEEFFIGDWSTRHYTPIEIKEHKIQRRIEPDRLRIFAKKGNEVIGAEVNLISKTPDVPVWTEVRVPWSFSGGGAEFRAKPSLRIGYEGMKKPQEEMIEKAAEYMATAGVYKEKVVNAIEDLADKHSVSISSIGHTADVTVFPRTDFSNATRRIEHFLADYDPEKIRRTALEEG